MVCSTHRTHLSAEGVQGSMYRRNQTLFCRLFLNLISVLRMFMVERHDHAFAKSGRRHQPDKHAVKVGRRHGRAVRAVSGAGGGGRTGDGPERHRQRSGAFASARGIAR